MNRFAIAVGSSIALCTPALAASETADKGGFIGLLMIFVIVWMVVRRRHEKAERAKFGDRDYEIIKAARASARSSGMISGFFMLLFGLFLLYISGVLFLGLHLVR